jgi:hypothetical protein
MVRVVRFIQVNKQHPFVRSETTIPSSRPAFRQSAARSGSQGCRRQRGGNGGNTAAVLRPFSLALASAGLALKASSSSRTRRVAAHPGDGAAAGNRVRIWRRKIDSFCWFRVWNWNGYCGWKFDRSFCWFGGRNGSATPQSNALAQLREVSPLGVAFRNRETSSPGTGRSLSLGAKGLISPARVEYAVEPS